MRVVNSRRALLGMLLELVGIKSGLVLQQEHLIRFLEQSYEKVDQVALVIGGSSPWWRGELDEFVAVRAEELEANFILVMNSIGAIPDCRTPYQLAIDTVLQNPAVLGIDPTNGDMVEEAIDKLDACLADGEITTGFEELAQEYQRRDIMNRAMPIQRQWDGLVPLNDLFESEDIPAGTTAEHYFDQRYIDYLNAQSGDLTSIHWRQFELLTGEYFRQQGYKVTVTPPRGDGGVDVIAERPNDLMGPDLIVVQCRRYEEDHPVAIEEIKAFWTSVDEQKATKGLIVTTSRLTSGGHAFVEAHKYRLSAAEGDNVRKWILALSTTSAPLTG